MESFLSRATLPIVLVVVGIVIAIPIAGPLVFADLLPARWRFENWPLWLQIPFGVIGVLYAIADVWFLFRPPGKSERKKERSTA